MIRRALGERRTLAITTCNIGALALSEGRRDDARRALEESIALALEIGYDWLIGGIRLLLAEIARLDGDLDRSESLLQDTLERGERLGDQNLLGECRQAIGNLNK